jgi:hypothetical protein
MSEGELCWRTAGKRRGKLWVGLEEELFNGESATYELDQE